MIKNLPTRDDFLGFLYSLENEIMDDNFDAEVYDSQYSGFSDYVIPKTLAWIQEGYERISYDKREIKTYIDRDMDTHLRISFFKHLDTGETYEEHLDKNVEWLIKLFESKEQ